MHCGDKYDWMILVLAFGAVGLIMMSPYDVPFHPTSLVALYDKNNQDVFFPTVLIKQQEMEERYMATISPDLHPLCHHALKWCLGQGFCVRNLLISFVLHEYAKTIKNEVDLQSILWFRTRIWDVLTNTSTTEMSTKDITQQILDDFQPYQHQWEEDLLRQDYNEWIYDITSLYPPQNHSLPLILWRMEAGHDEIRRSVFSQSISLIAKMRYRLASIQIERTRLMTSFQGDLSANIIMSWADEELTNILEHEQIVMKELCKHSQRGRLLWCRDQQS